MYRSTATIDVQRHQWPSLQGTEVEVWRQGLFYRLGLVDDVMPDGSGLWLAFEGCQEREFVGIDFGDEVKAYVPAPVLRS